MTSIVGNAAAQAAFLAATRSGTLHHAWLIAGPRGVGKATFARAAALRMLAAAAPARSAHLGGMMDDAPTRALIEAGSHPDFRLLHRLPKDADKPEQDLARSITVAQVRSLLPMFATAPSLSSRRVVVIDSIDDLERNAANALLKSLEEPPEGTIFLLVSHAPGKLLPTIRSRCRLLRFARLSDTETQAALHAAMPDADPGEIAALVDAADGAPGMALRLAGLDIAALDGDIAAIASDGDPANARRIRLARSLGAKAALPRYEAFLERAPAHIARAARNRRGPRLRIALEAHDAARELAGAALALSLDAQTTVFEMAGHLARLSG